MATGIVSLGLALYGYSGLSMALLLIALTLWLALATSAMALAFTDPSRLAGEVRAPSCLAAVAGSCVLATALAGRGDHVAAALLLAIGVALLVSLLPTVLPALAPGGPGSVFLLAVAPLSAAVAAAVLAPWAGSWLLVFGLAFAALGILAYAFALSRFDFTQLLSGPGDQWIAGGAAAIAAVACSEIARACSRLHILGAIDPILRGSYLVLTIVASLWLAVLIATEIFRLRLTFDRRRWATAFPVGMYAVMYFSVGMLESSKTTLDVARAWLWAGVAVWTLCAGAAIRSLKQEPRPTRCERLANRPDTQALPPHS